LYRCRMRGFALCLLLAACGRPDEATPDFDFGERLDTRALAHDTTLPLGRGLDPLSLAPRTSNACPSFEVPAPRIGGSSLTSLVIDEARLAEPKLLPHFAGLGADGEAMARATAGEVEAAFQAGARGVRVRSLLELTLVRTAFPRSCAERFPTAAAFFDTCGSAFVYEDGFIRGGVWLERVRPPSDISIENAPPPVHFVAWGAPAPAAPTDEAFAAAFTTPDVADPSLRDAGALAAGLGARRPVRFLPWPSPTLRSCVMEPIDPCLSETVQAWASLRQPGGGLQMLLASWRNNPRLDEGSQPSTSERLRGQALLERFDTCRDVTMPGVVAACLDAARAGRSNLCAACQVPQTCAPKRLFDDLENLGFPRPARAR
ncbi:MAG: hypothetical protein MUC96_35630, partial [Myxococcaceae bacterium]|nr:hypothetical protein [Myxococcaceae bacterium]